MRKPTLSHVSIDDFLLKFFFRIQWIIGDCRWLFTKLLPNQSRTKESLHFLLDHPRRCFIYLFPSRQTWLLLFIVLLLKYVSYFLSLNRSLISLQYHRLRILHCSRYWQSRFRVNTCRKVVYACIAVCCISTQLWSVSNIRIVSHASSTVSHCWHIVVHAFINDSQSSLCCDDVYCYLPNRIEVCTV